MPRRLRTRGWHTLSLRSLALEPFFRTGGAQDVAQHAMSLVTGVLARTLWVVRSGQRHRQRPRSRPPGGIVDRDGPLDRARAGRRESLDDAQLLAGGAGHREHAFEVAR